jgi:hypothetical protein
MSNMSSHSIVLPRSAGRATIIISEGWLNELFCVHQTVSRTFTLASLNRVIEMTGLSYRGDIEVSQQDCDCCDIFGKPEAIFFYFGGISTSPGRTFKGILIGAQESQSLSEADRNQCILFPFAHWPEWMRLSRCPIGSKIAVKSSSTVDDCHARPSVNL